MREFCLSKRGMNPKARDCAARRQEEEEWRRRGDLGTCHPNFHIKFAAPDGKWSDPDVLFCIFYIKFAGLDGKWSDPDVLFCFFDIKFAGLDGKGSDLDVLFCFFDIKFAKKSRDLGGEAPGNGG